MTRMTTHRSTLLSVATMLFLLSGTTSCNKTFEPQHPLNANASSREEVSDKPNIIFIMGDDIGYEAMSFNGGTTFYTPVADSLSNNALRFTNLYSAPLTSPSKFMAFTGKYIFRNYTQWGHMDTSNRTIANMLRDFGYNTCFAGKWQLDGGDAAIKALGFNYYSAYNVGKVKNEDDGGYTGKGSQYKNPTVYQDGNFLPKSETTGKYGDDLYTNYIESFIDSNKNNPFFVFYATGLAHSPYGPTPDDPEFAAWDGKTSDRRFFGSMLTYQDKKIGEILNKVKEAGLEDNTIIILVHGDNGTAGGVEYVYKNRNLKGAKGESNILGTHVPMLISFNGRFKVGVNRDLIDFTDFMPTIADMAGTKPPSDYGILDGVSFYPRLVNQKATPRKWIFTQTELQYPDPRQPFRKRYVFDENYKLYDSTFKFYNLVTDPLEKKPLKDADLTQKEKNKIEYFKSILETMHN